MKLVVFTLAAVVLALSVLVSLQLIEAGKTHDALCTFKTDLQKRSNVAEALIAEHPNARLIDVDPGPGSFVVSKQLLQNSVKNQNQTLHSLSGLKCN